MFRTFEPPTAPGEPIKYKDEKFDLRHNTLFILKSRNVEYEITAKSQKVFIMCMRIAGPKGPKF